jgi:DNA modification methylase
MRAAFPTGKEIITVIELNKIYNMDCVEGMKLLNDNSIDSIVTDPPYELGFMGKKWDSTGIAYNVELWQEALRVLKPGGHLLAFGGTRTYHRMTCAIEDAGFEIRDCIQWLYGSGFPKSHDISKAIDKKLGAEREVIGKGRGVGKKGGETYSKYGGFKAGEIEITASATELARKWNGWGTALKPANEPIVLARKPLSEKTIAENVMKWGTGGINIDDCRIAYDISDTNPATNPLYRKENGYKTNYGIDSNPSAYALKKEEGTMNINNQGRFPANVILDEEAGKMLDKQSGISKSTGGSGEKSRGALGKNVYGKYSLNIKASNAGGLGDSGGASRFFYCAKASKKERGEGNNHPTVKPVSLIKYLVSLITPPDGVCLDPFMGSGTTAVACIKTNRKYIGFELLEEYCKIAEKRISETTSNQIELPEIERNVPQRQFDWLDELLEGERNGN